MKSPLSFSLQKERKGNSAFLYLSYGKKYSIDCNSWDIFHLINHLKVAFKNDFDMKEKLKNIGWDEESVQLALTQLYVVIDD